MNKFNVYDATSGRHLGGFHSQTEAWAYAVAQESRCVIFEGKAWWPSSTTLRRRQNEAYDAGYEAGRKAERRGQS